MITNSGILITLVTYPLYSWGGYFFTYFFKFFLFLFFESICQLLKVKYIDKKIFYLEKFFNFIKTIIILYLIIYTLINFILIALEKDIFHEGGNGKDSFYFFIFLNPLNCFILYIFCKFPISLSNFSLKMILRNKEKYFFDFLYLGYFIFILTLPLPLVFVSFLLEYFFSINFNQFYFLEIFRIFFTYCIISINFWIISKLILKKKNNNNPFKLMILVFNIVCFFVAIKTVIVKINPSFYEKYLFGNINQNYFNIANKYFFSGIFFIIFTIFFQLYLWLIHDKLADRLSHWWREKKTKKLS